MVGAELTVRRGSTELSVDPAFEHAVMVIEGHVRINSLGMSRTRMLYLSPGRSKISIAAEGAATLLLIGGEPFKEDLVMWWNFIGRTHEDIAQARADWQVGADRFGTVAGHDGRIIPAPELPRARLNPRHRRPVPSPFWRSARVLDTVGIRNES